MRLRALVLLFIACLQAKAGELIIHGPSIHSSNNSDTRIFDHQETRDGKLYDIYMVTRRYNNRNYGLGYRTDSGLLIGLYNNSYYKVTAYIGKQVMFTEHLGGFVAVGTGYKSVTRFPLAPLGGLILKVPLTDSVSLDIMGLPKLGRIDGLLHATIAYKF